MKSKSKSARETVERLTDSAAKAKKDIGKELEPGVVAAQTAGARAKDAVEDAVDVVKDDASDAATGARRQGRSVRKALQRGARDLALTIKRSWARVRAAK